jgi:hypothetical protein
MDEEDENVEENVALTTINKKNSSARRASSPNRWNLKQIAKLRTPGLVINISKRTWSYGMGTDISFSGITVRISFSSLHSLQTHYRIACESPSAMRVDTVTFPQ